MAGSDDEKKVDKCDAPTSGVISFPQSRVRPPGDAGPYKDLGTTTTRVNFDLPEEPSTGHWCSHCKGIWFGYLLEVECPACGSRDG